MYRKDKQFMKNPATSVSRIYVGNLAKTVIVNDLEEKFKGYGNILGLVLNNAFGFVQYETEDEARAAVKNENGSILHGRKLIVNQAVDRSRPGGNQAPPQKQSGPPQKQGPPPPQMGPPQKQGPPPNQSPRQNNPPHQKTPPPPQTAQQQTSPAPKNNQSEQPLKFEPPERESDFQDENMEDDRPNIRPPGPPQHNDDRGRKNVRKNQRGGRNEGRGRSNERDHFIDRFEPPPKMDMYREGPYYGRDDRDFIPPGPRGGAYPPSLMDAPPPEKNDCEIIVVAKALTEYAEFIEQKLKTLGLIVDLLFPNEDVPIGKVLANISSRGCLYAILVMPQNEEHRSLTLNILHGIAQEHRNMPIEDAMILISRNFEGYMKGEQVPPETPGQSINDRHPTGIQVVCRCTPLQHLSHAEDVSRRHTEDSPYNKREKIKKIVANILMLNLLAENRQLTSSQYDKLIKYLQDRRELQHEYEVEEGIQPDSQESDSKQAELQSRILNILNKSNDSPIPTSITAPDPAPAPAQAPILKDPTVQKALDSLLLGDMFKNMSNN